MIRGFFNPAPGLPVPWVRCFLLLPEITQRWDPVDFLIDTGCTMTTLHPTDAVYRLGIQQTRLERPEEWRQTLETIGIGGSSTDFPVTARYAFLHEDGEREIVDGQILVAQLTPATQRLPSLLGWDILREFELTANLQDGLVTLRSLRSRP